MPQDDEDDLEHDEPHGPPRYLVSLAETATQRLADYEPGVLISLGREDPFEYEGTQQTSLVDEWDGTITVLDDNSATVAFAQDAEYGVSGIGWREYARILRASVESRRYRENDVELVEDPMGEGLGYRIRVAGVRSLRDLYDKTQAIERELLSPIRSTQLKLAEFVDQTEVGLRGNAPPVAALLEAVESATSAAQKGTTLETLVGALFRTVPNMVVASTRVRTETEEIDLLIYNERLDARWQREAFYIPVECKNWSSSCGKNEIVVFLSKLRNRKQRASCGVFVSWNGYTGPSTLELVRTSEGHPAVLLLSGEDVIRAVRRGDFLAVLNEKLDEAVLS